LETGNWKLEFGAWGMGQNGMELGAKGLGLGVQLVRKFSVKIEIGHKRNGL
jgi:hypothetical protein